MPHLSHPGVRFVAGIVLPAVAILAATIGTLVYALNDIASEVNRTEVASTRRTVEAAVQATLRHMQNTHGDYAVWDDAARKLYGAVDQQFVDDSFVSSTADPVFFDTVYLLDSDGATVFAYRRGSAIKTPPRSAFGPAFDRLMQEVPLRGTSNDAHSALVSGAWGPMVVAVGPVVPFSQDLPMPKKPRTLVLGKSFDDAMVAQLSQDYLIDGLKIIPASAVDRSSAIVPLTDPDGKVIAALQWSDRRPGSEALARLNPRVMAMFAALAITMLALVAIAARDFAKVRKGEAMARHAATHDALSGLPNRSALLEHLRQSVGDQRRNESDLAILYLDLDGFKEVNDSYGHDVGDQLLRKVAKGFEAMAGDHLLVRLGGDEFAVVVTDPRAAAIAWDLGERLVRFFNKPFDVGGRVISISASVGIALIDGADISVDEALRRADVAMYQAKQQGRNRVCAFDDSLDAMRLKRIAIAAELRRSLERDELMMLYQPVYGARDGNITSVEALVRWPRSDDSRPISPVEFIPIAEETGLIDELGVWTLRRACRDALAWPGIKVAVNVSPAQFHNPHFANTVAILLKDVGFPPDRLEIEITETYLITHPETAAKGIDAVRALGIAVALDDFGIGYSSIGYLRSFTFDKLKLDRSLIANIDRDPHAQKLVQATVTLAGALNLSVTAEGVETEEEATLLRIAGCDAFQGFYFGRPSPASEITALLGTDARLHRTDRSLRLA